MPKISFYFFIVVLFTTGCSFGGQNKDLHAFMEQAKSAPRGQVEPLPTFGSYQTFNYSSLALRSPFDVPLRELAKDEYMATSEVKPDESRAKMYLERFNFSSFALVGSVSMDDTLWSLIRFVNEDNNVRIEKVRSGDYLGKNHGKIVANAVGKVDVVEIVPDGKGNWLERPRTLVLADKG